MQKIRVVLGSCLFSFVIIFISCSSNNRFDKEVWLEHNNALEKFNPRAGMTDDLLKNYLKPGLDRDYILTLLGTPYKDGIEKRLPANVAFPDSLKFRETVRMSYKKKKQLNEELIDQINEFNRLNSQPDTLMLYPVGHSTMDGNYLVIKFNGQGKTSEFWVEQH